ncbi:MAG TPA: HAMP domain-containing protein, partial [Candidatus Cryosericum sp.]|nr:HAMP domain-containing protein [Candidatus Cryosericum sp.]
MKKGSIFQKFLFYLIFGCVLTSSLAVFVYLGTGASVHARRIADEMLPRAESMARLAERLQSGQVSYDSFIDFAIKNQQGTRVFIFDENAKLIAFTSDSVGTDSGSTMMPGSIVSDSILASGKKVVDSGEELISTKWLSQDGIVVGVAITDNMQRVTGAIVMTRPTYEVYSSLMGFVRALMLSSLIASAGMAIPAYFISRRMTNPISSMIRASVAMAGGDFSVRADESREDELGQLGFALNHLSEQVRRNINDLILAKNRLHIILDGLQEGVIALEADQTLIYHNQAACHLFGVCSNDELLQAIAPVLPLC